MNNIKKFKTFFANAIILIIIIPKQLFAVDILRLTVPNIVDTYKEYYETVQLLTNDLCEKIHGTKEAICNEIFSDSSFQQEHQIYLNKAALFERRIVCENHAVRVDNTSLARPQLMFPCFGRHHPLQTSVLEDDYYEFIYLSAGPFNDFVFVYHRVRTMANDKYYVKEMVSIPEMMNLPLLQITQEIANADLQSLSLVSINANRKVIELNYIKRTVGRLFIPPYSICNLPNAEKLRLCQYFVNSIPRTQSFGYILWETEFNKLPINCVPRNILIVHYQPRAAEPQMMFPCFGYFIEDGSILQLSDGYYIKSFLVLRRSNPQFESYNLIASVHNVNFIP